MRSFFKRFVFAFNIIAIILLCGSYLSTYVNPNESWIFALMGIAYPFLLLINVFFALFWFFQFNIKGFFSLGIIVLGWPFLNKSFQFKASKSDSVSDLTICSYNVGLFGYFQSKWHTNEMIQKVNEIKADVLCIQEFLNLKNENESTFDSIKKACDFKYAYFDKLKDGRKKGEYGMAIFSKYPLTNPNLVQFDGLTGNMCLSVDVLVDTMKMRLYNVHLQSFKFNKQDYKFINSIPKDNNEKLNASKGILSRMKNAYIKRSNQVARIKEDIATCQTPYFVIGDFNDPPVSYSYNELSVGLKDAFVENGSGMGKTYIGLMPNFRIDYILYPREFNGLWYETYKLSSDHSLVSTGLKFKSE